MAGEAGKIAAALKKHGRTMVLRRRIGTTSAFQEVQVKGVSAGYKPAEVTGLLQQGDRRVTISNAEIAAQSAFTPPPRKGDFLTIDGVQTAIQGVETKPLGDTVLAHVLWVRG